MGWAGCFSARWHNSPSSTGSCEPGSQVSLTSGAPLRQLSSSLVPHSKNCDGAAQVVRLISPLLCGGSTGQLCPWCPPTAPPTPPSLAWAAAVPHGESLSLRELHWSLLQPPDNTCMFLRPWNMSRMEESLSLTNCEEWLWKEREISIFTNSSFGWASPALRWREMGSSLPQYFAVLD